MSPRVKWGFWSSFDWMPFLIPRGTRDTNSGSLDPRSHNGCCFVHWGWHHVREN